MTTIKDALPDVPMEYRLQLVEQVERRMALKLVRQDPDILADSALCAFLDERIAVRDANIRAVLVTAFRATGKTK